MSATTSPSTCLALAYAATVDGAFGGYCAPSGYAGTVGASSSGWPRDPRAHRVGLPLTLADAAVHRAAGPHQPHQAGRPVAGLVGERVLERLRRPLRPAAGWRCSRAPISLTAVHPACSSSRIQKALWSMGLR